MNIYKLLCLNGLTLFRASFNHVDTLFGASFRGKDTLFGASFRKNSENYVKNLL